MPDRDIYFDGDAPDAKVRTVDGKPLNVGDRLYTTDAAGKRVAFGDVINVSGYAAVRGFTTIHAEPIGDHF